MGNLETSQRFLEAVWNQGDISAVDEICAEGFAGHDPAVGDFDRETGKSLISGYRQAFPDLHFTIEDCFESGDKVVTRWRSEGTFSNEFMGLEPTGRKDEVTGIVVDRYEDGKIAESWAQWDNLKLMRDIGAIPTEVGASA